jgi:hypothetical protein
MTTQLNDLIYALYPVVLAYLMSLFIFLLVLAIKIDLPVMILLIFTTAKIMLLVYLFCFVYIASYFIEKCDKYLYVSRKSETKYYRKLMKSLRPIRIVIGSFSTLGDETCVAVPDIIINWTVNILIGME